MNEIKKTPGQTIPSVYYASSAAATSFAGEATCDGTETASIDNNLVTMIIVPDFRV
jgi:hypothetical protein